MGQPRLPGRGPEILANLLHHPGGCYGVVTWSCAARTRHVSDLFLAGGAGWLLRPSGPQRGPAGIFLTPQRRRCERRGGRRPYDSAVEWLLEACY